MRCIKLAGTGLPTGDPVTPRMCDAWGLLARSVHACACVGALVVCVHVGAVKVQCYFMRQLGYGAGDGYKARVEHPSSVRVLNRQKLMAVHLGL